jgi:putative SOS response-associated peptidase YedK
MAACRTIITGEPNEFVREIHTRMPVILPEEHHEAWLSGEAGKKIWSVPGEPNESVTDQCSCK